MEKEKDVVFRLKSAWQKKDCIRGTCHSISMFEAVCGNAMVRCCGDEKCKARAAELARQQSS